MPSEFQKFDKDYPWKKCDTSCYDDYKSKLHAAIYEYLKTKGHIEEKKKKKKKKEEDPIETWLKKPVTDSGSIGESITQWFTNDFEYPDDVKDERIKKVYLVQVLEWLLLDITEHKRNSKVFVNFKLETYHNETKKGTVIAFLKALQHEDKDPISKEKRTAAMVEVNDNTGSRAWGKVFGHGGRRNKRKRKSKRKRTKRKIKRKQRRKQTKRKRTKRKRTKRRTKRKRTKRTKRRSKQSRRRRR